MVRPLRSCAGDLGWTADWGDSYCVFDHRMGRFGFKWIPTRRARSLPSRFALPFFSSSSLRKSDDPLDVQIIETIPGTADEGSITLSPQPVGGEKVTLDALRGRKVGDMGFRWVFPFSALCLFMWIGLMRYGASHGDMLFMSYKPLETPTTTTATTATEPIPTTAQPSIAIPTQPDVTEDAVDTYWRARDGKIERKRDPTMCRHGEKGMCDYCMPVEVSFGVAGGWRAS